MPLTDEDRWPWLQAIADEIDRLSAAGERAVIACSALKRAYRDILVHGRDDVRIVFLDGTQDLIAARLAARKGTSCRRACSPASSRRWSGRRRDERPITVSIDAPVEEIVDDIVTQLNLSSPMTRIALVVSDVDGTLLTKDKVLTDGRPRAACTTARGRHRLHHHLQPADHRHGFSDRATCDHAADRRVQRQFDR